MKLSGHLFHDMTSIKWVSAHKEGQEKSGSYDNFKSVGDAIKNRELVIFH